MKILMDRDPVAKSASTWVEEGDEVIIHNVQDAQPIIDANKAEFNQKKRSTPYGEMERVASLPLTIYFDLQRRGILDDEKAFRRWLNDPDNSAFRTRPGKV